MKNLFKTVFIGVALFNLNMSYAAEGIKFEKDLSIDEMIIQAEAEDKLIFVDAYATWCGPCKQMSNNVFTDEEVAAFFNKNFLNVKLDMESEVGQMFDEFFNITAYPTLMFLDHNGEVITKEEGSKSVRELLLMGEIVLDPSKDPILDLIRDYNLGELSDDLKVELVREMAGKQMEYDSIITDYFGDRAIDFKNDNDNVMFYFENSTLENRNVQALIKRPKLYFNNGGEDLFYSKVKEVVTSELLACKLVDKEKELEPIREFIKTVLKIDPEVEIDQWLETISEIYDGRKNEQ